MHPSAVASADALPDPPVTNTRRAVLVAALAVLLLVLLRNAWLVEDAYITFRTVDNLVGGHGATWNTAERVQAYTHPLWMLVTAAFYAVTHDVYYTSIALSVVLTLATVAALGIGVATSAVAATIAAALLVASKAFVDFSVSGLENPLTHLLAVAFLWTWWSRPRAPRRLLLLALWAGLAAVNRMDTLLLFAPALAAEALALRDRRALGALALGFAPFIAWEAFALLYYGFPFPNPAYAKLAAGISRLDLAAQGLHYFRNSILVDPPTLVAIAGGIGVAIAGRHDRRVPIAAGIVLYLVYVVWIGGDFMSGRFFAAPLVCATALIARVPWAGARSRVSMAAAIVVLVALSPHAPVFSGPGYRQADPDLVDDHDIADERGYYFQSTGLFRADGGRGADAHPDAVRGRALRARGPQVVLGGNIGFFGFHAGPDAHIVDVFALAEPLLARLPARSIVWRVGHYVRDLPPGYWETLTGSAGTIEDARVRAVHDGLSRVTRGPLFDPRRLAEIWRFNTGRYRAALEPLFASRRLQERGAREIEARRTVDAVATLEKSLALDPRRGASWYLLFEVGLQRGALTDARTALFRAILLSPGRYDDGLVALAAAHQEREEFAPAAALCEAYLSGHPDVADAHATLALSYERLGRSGEAVAHYRRALALDPAFREVADRLRALEGGGEASP